MAAVPGSDINRDETGRGSGESGSAEKEKEEEDAKK